jgi:hypothetical protein
MSAMNDVSRLSVLLGTASCALAFGAVGMAAMMPTPWEHGIKGEPPDAPRPIQSRSLSCPLPVAQQVKAVKAFREMMPVFLHPRCANCHGGVNPFIQGTGSDPADAAAPASTVAHGGGTIRRQNDKAPDGTVLIESECQDCHNNMAARRDGSKSVWMTAPNFLSFVAKDATTLCKQIKRTSHDAKDLIGHMTDDNGGNNFTATAYNGDRGLDPDQYGDIPRVSPSISHEGFIRLGQKWVAAMGGELKGDESCGCVMPRIKLEVRHTQVMEVPQGLPSREASNITFQVNLEPAGEDKPGFFLGERSLTRTIDMTLPQYCEGKASRRERWQLWALIDSVSGSIRVAQVAFDELPKGYIECRNDRGKGKIDPLFPLPGPGNSPGFQELLIPADSTTKTVKAGDKTWSESLTITVLEVPR